MLKETWQHKDIRILFMGPDWLEKRVDKQSMPQDNITYR